MKKINLEEFPTSESAKKMLSYVSDGFYDESYVGKWIFQVMGEEYDKALEIVMDLPAQFYPETATWGLMYHEIKWGLPVRQNLPYEERRRLIFLKRDYRSPMTPYHMEKYLADATGFEVHIADISDPGEYGFVPPHPNVFKAYFLGEGSLDSKVVFETLDRLKQSHTIYTVNDRTEVVLDNRNLEQIILRNIRFKMGIPFWCDFVFDGSWRLDGFTLLDKKKRYGLSLGMSHRFEIANQSKNLKLYSSVMWKQHNQESIATGAVFHVAIDFWRLMLNHSQCKARMALTVRSKLDFSEQETVGNATVETKTWDYWFLDGALSLDGARSFNSIYRKEVVG